MTAKAERSRFCCRSDLDKPDVDQTEEKEDDFVKAFKVANFEITASAEDGKQLTRRSTSNWAL